MHGADIGMPVSSYSIGRTTIVRHKAFPVALSKGVGRIREAQPQRCATFYVALNALTGPSRARQDPEMQRQLLDRVIVWGTVSDPETLRVHQIELSFATIDWFYALR